MPVVAAGMAAVAADGQPSPPAAFTTIAAFADRTSVGQVHKEVRARRVLA